MAKRKHRHVIETVVTLLSTAHLPHNFLTYVVSHAVFLINKMPCKGFGMQSPFLKLFRSLQYIHKRLLLQEI